MMKFTCQNSVLLDSLVTSSRAVSVKSTIPALEGILIEADQTTGLRLSSYNLEIGIRTYTPADVENAGSTIINARLLSDIVRRLPDESVTIAVNDDGNATIRCGAVEYDIPTMQAEEFPDIPTVDPEKNISITQKILKDMITRTIFAVSVSDAKPVLTGLYFDINESLLTIVAIDNYRMALRRETFEAPISGDSPLFSFILPGQTARELEKILSDTDDKLEITLSQKFICFAIGDTTIISRLIDGDYYAYKGFIPKEGSTRAVVGTSRFSAAVDRVSLIINDRLKNHIRMVVDETNVKLSSMSTLGRAADAFSVESFEARTDEPVEIGFNNRYLAEALKAVDDDSVCVELTSSVHPCVIRPVGAESQTSKYLHVLMPVRLKNI